MTTGTLLTGQLRVSLSRSGERESRPVSGVGRWCGILAALTGEGQTRTFLRSQHQDLQHPLQGTTGTGLQSPDQDCWFPLPSPV